VSPRSDIDDRDNCLRSYVISPEKNHRDYPQCTPLALSQSDMDNRDECIGSKPENDQRDCPQSSPQVSPQSDIDDRDKCLRSYVISPEKNHRDYPQCSPFSSVAENEDDFSSVSSVSSRRSHPKDEPVAKRLCFETIQEVCSQS